MHKQLTLLAAGLMVWLGAGCRVDQSGIDLIVHHGRIVTVDSEFSVREAMAVKAGRIVRVGSNEEVLQMREDHTVLLDLGGKMVMPGLIDTHVHPVGASLTEFDHPIGEMEGIADVLGYIRDRAEKLEEGEWIILQQVFITRLLEQRYPTRQELDDAAPRHPVVFRTGPDASLNSLALKLSGIDKDFKVDDGGPGYVEKDPQTGEPTGILRSCRRYIKSRASGRKATDANRYQRLLRLFQDYNSVGITSIYDGGTNESNLELYQKLLKAGDLSVRIRAQYRINTLGPLEEVLQRIRKVAANPLCQGGPMLRVTGIKTVLDGGMLTGSAYMRKPWGVSRIYAINDPDYRGVLFIPKDRLKAMVRTTTQEGLQFTAHAVGDGAVHNLLEVYEQVDQELPMRKLRPCITHSNFMSREAVEALVRIGGVALIQPPWLYLDTRTLADHFGVDRLRYFQPLRSIFAAGGMTAGGSDHMQKIGSLRSVNPYNPFLGMWTAITRRAKLYDQPLHPEESLNREQAIRFYTYNGAWAMFAEKEVGSLEVGKRADFIVVDRDLLKCPVDEIRDTKVLRTYLDGELIFEK